VICSNFLSPFLLQFQSGPNLQHAHPIDGVSFVTMMHNKNSEIQKKNIKRKTKEERRHPRQKKSVLYAELDTLYVRALVHFIQRKLEATCVTPLRTPKRDVTFFYILSPPARFTFLNIPFVSLRAFCSDHRSRLSLRSTRTKRNQTGFHCQIIRNHSGVQRDSQPCW
jgi:hypothetical protein